MNNLLPQPRDVAVTDASEKKLYYFSLVTHISSLGLVFYKYDLQNYQWDKTATAATLGLYKVGTLT